MSIQPNIDLATEILIIGAGAAGLAAAAAASEQGINNITVLETRNCAGGNFRQVKDLFAIPYESEIITKQYEIDLFKKAMDYNHWTTNPVLTRILVEQSKGILKWLETKGLEFKRYDETDGDPSPVVKIKNTEQNTGEAIIQTLLKTCRQNRVNMLYHTEASSFIFDTCGQIKGITARKANSIINISADKIIIATGGFAGNRDLLKKYLPGYKEDAEIYLTGLPLKGTGMLLAEQARAALDGPAVMELSLFPFPWSVYISFLIKHPAMLWLNRRGKRFTDESVIFPEYWNCIYRQPLKVYYSIFDETTKQRIYKEELGIREKSIIPLGSWPRQADEDLELMQGKTRLIKSDSLKDIAKWIGICGNELKTTIEQYNSFCDCGIDTFFGKDKAFLSPIKTPPFYCIKCGINMLLTHGCVKVNRNMQVLDEQENPIAGLYCAGADIGGIDAINYNFNMPGHSSAFSLGSGYIAGIHAATPFS